VRRRQRIVGVHLAWQGKFLLPVHRPAMRTTMRVAPRALNQSFVAKAKRRLVN